MRNDIIRGLNTVCDGFENLGKSPAMGAGAGAGAFRFIPLF